MILIDNKVQAELQELVDLLHSDLNMLLRGEWQPDKDSVEASIETLEAIASKVGITPKEI